MNCAAHGVASVGVCSRCGLFACGECFAGTTLCLACRQRGAPDDARHAKARQYAKASWAAPVIGFVVNMIWSTVGSPTIKGLLFVGLCVAGFCFGLAALIMVRGARVERVFAPAIVGMLLSTVPMLFCLGGVVVGFSNAVTRGR